MTKRKIILNLIKYACLCLALSATGYVIIVFQEVSLKMEEIKIKILPGSASTSLLEEGSLIKKDILETYLTFSDYDDKNEQWFRENDFFKQTKPNELLVNQDVVLPKILDNHCRRLRCFKNVINFEKIPSSLWKGLIGIEDNRFLEHEGIDYRSIFRAFVADLKAMKLVQGGSTLTQQLAKNLFLSNEKKIERKIREMLYAIYIESKLKKEDILALYFNEVFWGTLGGIYIKGVNAAALMYFNKKPEFLTDYEAAILIGLLKGPFFYHPLRHLERLKKRAEVVYQRLLHLNLIATEKNSIWSHKKWAMWEKQLKQKDESSLFNSLYLTTQNYDKLIQPFEKIVLFESISNVENLLTKQIDKLDIGIKFLALDKKCKGFNCPGVFSHYNKIERKKNEAIFEEKHQVGSVLKPIIYEQFLNFGKKLDDLVSTAPITLKLKSGDWVPKDAVKVQEDYVTLRYAIQKSKNIPLIRIASDIGFGKIQPLLQDYFPNLLVPLAEYPAQLLGAIELSLGELALAYLKYFEKSCQSINNKLYDFEDSILYELSKASETTISKVASQTMKQLMIFGKTGTTNSGLDNWYVAFDGKTFYAIWFGVDAKRKDKKLKLSGALSAFRIFQYFLQYRGKQIFELYCH